MEKVAFELGPRGMGKERSSSLAAYAPGHRVGPPLSGCSGSSAQLRVLSGQGWRRAATHLRSGSGADELPGGRGEGAVLTRAEPRSLAPGAALRLWLSSGYL